MSVPRSLSLHQLNGHIQLKQEPVAQLSSLRERVPVDLPSQPIESTYPLPDLGHSFELIIQFSGITAKRFGVQLFKSETEETVIAYHADTQELVFDRSKSGETDFFPEFASVEHMPLILDQDSLELHILADQSVVEVFVNGGFESNYSTGIFQATWLKNLRCLPKAVR